MIAGRLEENIVDLLGIALPDDPMIYIGERNIKHIQANHPKEYEKYGSRISQIISEPDYVYHDVSDGTIEFIKEFCFDGEYVKVAVRATESQAYYVRSMYVVKTERVLKYIASGKLKRVNH